MAKKSRPQIWIEYQAVRTLLMLLRALPFSVAERIGLTAGNIGYAMLGNLRRVGERNLELAFPEKGADERSLILKSAFRNMGRVMAVLSRFGRLSPDNAHELIE